MNISEKGNYTKSIRFQILSLKKAINYESEPLLSGGNDWRS